MKGTVSKYKKKLYDFYNWNLSGTLSLSKNPSQSQLKDIQMLGRGVLSSQALIINRPQGLIIGDNVSFEGVAKIDATGGVILAKNSVIGNKSEICTQDDEFPLHDYRRYNPVHVWQGNKLVSSSKVGPGADHGFKKEYLLDSEQRDNLDLVFIVSTGRSGTKHISKLLNSKSEISCYHDAIPHFNKLCCEYLYKVKSREEIKTEILKIFSALDLSSGHTISFSDHKISPLISILKELFIKSKFIWLIREPTGFLNSAYPRGWYRNLEFDYQENPNEFFDALARPSDYHAANRISGYKCGEISENEWKSMTSFERLCWYYQYWNKSISDQFIELGATDKLKIKLENISNAQERIWGFLNVNQSKITLGKTNKARYTTLNKENWTQSMTAIYNTYSLKF